MASPATDPRHARCAWHYIDPVHAWDVIVLSHCSSHFSSIAAPIRSRPLQSLMRMKIWQVSVHASEMHVAYMMDTTMSNGGVPAS